MDDLIATLDRGIALISRYNLLDLLLDVEMTLECQEYWLDVGLSLVQCPCKISLLFFECVFMFFDKIIFVILNASETKNTVLHVVTHLLLVDVDPCLGILHEMTILSEFYQRVFTEIINFLRILISSHWQIDLWLDHM